MKIEKFSIIFFNFHMIFKENFDRNFFSAIRLSREVIPYMKQQHWGRIINLSSFPVMRHLTSYLCPKAALIRFTELLDLEVRSDEEEDLLQWIQTAQSP